jgi:hypothetical protein
MLLCLYLFLFLLLMLNVSFDYVFIYSYCANKIASSPEIIAPIRLLFHLRVALEQFYRQLTFQYPHHLRNRYLWRNRYDKMNVIILDTHFLNFTSFPFTQQLYIFLYKFLDFSIQDPKPIFWNPNNMVVTLVNNMRQFLVLTHVSNIGIADRTLPPPKEVGF